MLRAGQLDVERAFVLVIDMQEKLMPLVRHSRQVSAAAGKLLDGVRIFELPVLATEQYPHGLGPTVEPLRRRFRRDGVTALEKPTFSAWAHPPVREAILGVDRPQAVIVGVEAHVCVQQTTLDLRSRDYDVYVCADGIASRGRIDSDRALERMRQEGAFVTTVEAVLFELCSRCDTPRFKTLLEVIKETPPADDE